MRAILLFVLAAALCIAGAWWLAALPGTVSATIAGTTIETTAPIAITLIAVLFVILYLIIRIIAWVFRIPGSLGSWRRAGNRTRGDEAVTRTLIALATSDSAIARREARRSRKLLGDTPLTLLLAAHADRQAGRDADAQAIFERLAKRPDGKLLGLRGLIRQAMARQDWPAAQALAETAEAAHPGAKWLTEERRHMALRTGQWNEALRLTAPPSRRRAANTADSSTRAALAVAAANDAPDPRTALRLATQAWEAEPALAPAAIAYATALRSAQRDRAAQDILRRTWAARPHPDLAAAFLAPTTDPLARHRQAQELAAANPANPDSALLLSRTALDAGLTGEALRHAQNAQRSGLKSRRLWVTLADIAEAEGNQQAAQDALRHIPTADPDPTWRCLACGTPHQTWHPVCEACATPGRIAWTETTQIQRLTRPTDQEGFL